MAPLSAYLFRLKAGYSIGTERPKTMCRKLLRDSMEERLQAHTSALARSQDEEQVQTTVGAATEGARMLSMLEGDDVTDEQSPNNPPVTTTHVAHEGTRQMFSKSQCL